MKQAMQVTLKQTFSPKLQQAIRLLQLSTLELEQEILAALESNPLLELPDEYIDHIPKHSANLDPIPIANPEPGLHEYLLWQLNLSKLNVRQKLIAEAIIDSIDEDGYLSLSNDELIAILLNARSTELTDLELHEIEYVIKIVQQFDPAGVGARNLIECMLLQLQTKELNADLRQLCTEIVTNYLELLGKKDLVSLQHLLNIDNKTLEILIGMVRSLHPKPGRLYANDITEYIVPDVVVERVGQKWQLNLTNNQLHNLQISSNYMQYMKSSANTHFSRMLRKQYQEAQWLIDSIKTRNSTLMRVAEYLVAHQHEFLQDGEAKMRPLTLQVIAHDLGLSESTISRITSRKYMHTPRGTFELKYLFSNSVPGADSCSAVAIKAHIRNIIDQESAKSPLSDQQIVHKLHEYGIHIARRTVTKYREALAIQASTFRGL